MKKTLFFAIFSMLCLGAVSAQITLRPYAGISSNSLTEDFEDAEWKSKIGYQLGADLQIGNRFYVQPGVQVEFAKNAIDDLVGGGETDFTRTNLRIPVMVGYAFGQIDGNFAARIFTGPNASFVLNGKLEEDDVKDDLKSAVFGWNVGAGLDFSILFVDLGYQVGLSEVFENGLDNDSKNNRFYANVGLRVRF